MCFYEIIAFAWDLKRSLKVVPPTSLCQTQAKREEVEELWVSYSNKIEEN